MDSAAIALFRELADRPPSERDDYYASHQVPADLRAEVESLLRFDDEPGVSRIYRATAALHKRNGRDDLAAALEARRLELWRRWDRTLPNNPFVHRQIAATSAP